MKITKIVMLVVTVGIFTACNSQKTDKAVLKTENDSTSYALGSIQIENFWNQMTRFGADKFINKEKLAYGARDMKNNANKIANEDAINIIRKTLKKHQMDSTFQMPEASKGEDLKNLNDSFGYGLGVNIFDGISTGIKQFELQDSINMDILLKGIEDAINGSSKITTEVGSNLVNKIIKRASDRKAETEAAKYEGNKKEGEDFLIENAKRAEVKTTESGLQYEILKEGTGAQPQATDNVTVHYHGTLIDGTVFDSSVDRGEPASFELNRVISGWTEGVQLMKEGAKYKFYIPQELAYGNRATGSITPYSTLIFEVELISINK